MLSKLIISLICLIGTTSSYNTEKSIKVKLKSKPAKIADCGYSVIYSYLIFEDTETKKLYTVKAYCPNETLPGIKIDSTYCLKVRFNSQASDSCELINLQ